MQSLERGFLPDWYAVLKAAMTLSKGDFIKLIHVDPTKAVYVDWINARDPAPGDIAVVKEAFSTVSGVTVLLLCEPRSGFQEWGATFFEADLTYERLLIKPIHDDFHPFEHLARDR
ncbi:hypothetical protein [Pseudomonas protegens]|uniref:hypothetical protein n=1 Tax=Pseudomonas protegens TaxID=380021 RepID=UPI002263CD5D|nr:hypothetical protein [Pseudomonas protegens]